MVVCIINFSFMFVRIIDRTRDLYFVFLNKNIAFNKNFYSLIHKKGLRMIEKKIHSFLGYIEIIIFHD